MADLPTQAQFGRYRLVRVLGRGAMGVVYEARDPKLDRQVAIKTILKGHLLDDTVANDYSQRFVREAQAVARLSHPNIVTVFDFGEQDEAAYLVMEFIHGGELGAALAAGERFDLARSVDVMCELLAALAYAHEHGVVHRDVKPANVMIDRAGHVKLTDFGVARLVDSNTERTVPGTMVGTPSYMAPEQVQGLAVGSRADLFAAGVILYQLLTGRRPFVGDGGWAIQKQIVQEQPPLPSSVDPLLPPVFDAIVMRALAKDPAHRHESAEAFGRELRQALLAAGSGSAAPEPDPDATVLRPRLPGSAPVPGPTLSAERVGGSITDASRRRRWLWPLALTVLVAGAAGGVLLRRQPAQVQVPQVRTPTVLPSAPAPEPGTRAPAPPAAAAVVAAPSAALASPGASAASAAAEQHVAPSPSLAATVSPRHAPAPDPAAASLERGAPDRASVGAPSAQQRAAAIRAGASRCADLVQRIQLGDTLSTQEQDILQKECRR